MQSDNCKKGIFFQSYMYKYCTPPVNHLFNKNHSKSKIIFSAEYLLAKNLVQSIQQIELVQKFLKNKKFFNQKRYNIGNSYKSYINTIAFIVCRCNKYHPI